MQEKDRQSLCTGKRIAVILTISILVLATAGMALWLSLIHISGRKNTDIFRSRK